MDDEPRAWSVVVVRAALCAAVSCVASPVLADGWPATTPGWLSRGAGGGLSLLLVSCWWLLALGWVCTTDWVSRDSVKYGLAPGVWGPLTACVFVPLAVIAWWVPWTWAALVLTALAWLVPVLTYSFTRNPKVPQSALVLTAGHFKRIAAPLLTRFGIEVDTLDEAGDDLLPTVLVRTVAAGGTEADPSIMEKLAAAAGYQSACGVMQGAVVARAGKVRFDVAPAAVHVHHHVDGMWVKPRVMTVRGSKKEPEQWGDVPPFSRADGDAMLLVLKAVAGIDPRAKGRQSGGFVIDVDGKPRPGSVVVQTVPTGEQVIVEIRNKPPVYKALGDLGMAVGVVEKLSELLSLAKGVLVLASPPGSGLTTTFDVVVNASDRLMRDFISIEDAAAPAAEIQNVKPIRFDAKQNQTAVAVLEKALLDYPAAIVARDLRDPALVVELVRLADEEKFVILSLKASDAVEGITKLQACRVPLDQLGRSLLGSLSHRLVRKLCPRCRQAFQPPQELLQRLKKTPEQVPQLFRASSHGCQVCSGLGYMGQTAIFELASGPVLRKAVAAKAEPQVIRRAAVQDGMVMLRDAGMALVLEGVTSLEELQRVFAAPAAKQPAPGGKRA
jgi:general secretion pathway protein E